MAREWWPPSPSSSILGTIGLNLTPLLAGATVIGATLGFGAQSMVRDLLAGVLLTVEGQFDIGDTIAVGDTTGTVEDLTLRVTRLRSDDGTVWYVPNGEIRKLANSSRGWAQATVDVPVPVTAAVDTVLDAIRAAAEAVANDPDTAPLCLEPPRVWGVVAMAADTFTCRVSVRTATNRARTRGPGPAPGDRPPTAGPRAFRAGGTGRGDRRHTGTRRPGRRPLTATDARSTGGPALRRRPHGLDGHGPARSTLEGQGGLVHEHAEPAHRRRAAAPRPPRPAAASRAGGTRGRPPPGPRAGRRGRRAARRWLGPGAPRHADRCGLDDELGLGHIGARPHPARRSRQRRGRPRRAPRSG